MTPTEPAAAPGAGPKSTQAMRAAVRDRKRARGWQLWPALLVSLLTHTLLLGLAFSGSGRGAPGLGLSWHDRRVEVSDLRVTVVPARVTAGQPAAAPTGPPRHSAMPQPWVGGLGHVPPAPEAPLLQRSRNTVVPDAPPTPSVMPERGAEAEAAEPSRVTRTSDDATRLGTLGPGAATVARNTVTDKIALDPPVQPDWALFGELPLPETAIAVAPSASSPERALSAPRAANAEVLVGMAPLARERALDLTQLDTLAQEAKQRTERLQASSAEAARVDAEREQAARQLVARQEAAKQDTLRLEAARQEAARTEAARLAVERQELARHEAARAETARREAERLEAARQAAQQQEVARLEGARREAIRAEAARLETERQEAARARAAQADADTARREAARRAMGRQLDEEAARRRDAESAAAAIAPPSATSAAAGQPASLPLSWSSARRGRLLGRTDPNAELVLYAEAWARKIQLNMTFDQVREAIRQRHTSPLVTVAIRQDGSVESVNFVISSGVAQLDDAIRRIVQSQAPYPAFAPALARDFDVIEIRRTWSFDMAIRLY